MAIYSDKERIIERQEEMKIRQERKKETDMLRKKNLSSLKSTTSGK
jgi:hypothetical protein